MDYSALPPDDEYLDDVLQIGHTWTEQLEGLAAHLRKGRITEAEHDQLRAVAIGKAKEEFTEAHR